MPIRIAVVDDQALVRTGLRMILESEPDLVVVAEAETGLGALHEVRRTRPDVVLMDIQMPGLGGVEATRRILQAVTDHPVRILILTTFERDDYIFDALRAGASGFFLKNAPAEDLISAVRTVDAGNALLSPSVTRRVIAEFVQASPEL